MKTDINGIRDVAKCFLYFRIELTDMSPVFIHHPVFESAFQYIEGRGNTVTNILDSDDLLRQAQKQAEDRIDKCRRAEEIIWIINKPYRMTFLDYIKKYLSKEDFSRLLAEVWITSENPNMDANVSTGKAAEWFRRADKKSLMTEKDYNVYINIPDSIVLYRGVASGRNPYGLSWTASLDKAEWFAKRFGDEGYIEKIEAGKEDVLCYFGTRGEDEYVVDVEKIKKNIELM